MNNSPAVSNFLLYHDLIVRKRRRFADTFRDDHMPPELLDHCDHVFIPVGEP